MKVNKTNNKIDFGGFYNNKKLLKSLEFIGENAPIITSGATLLMSSIVRPVAIMSSSAKNKKDKEIASAKSISAGIIGFGITNVFFNKINKGIKNVEQNPDKFLSQEAIKLFELNKKNGTNKQYNFLKQSAKFASEFLTVIPKIGLTVLLITPITKMIFDKQKKEQKNKDKETKNNISFKGKFVEKLYSNFLENKKVQEIGLKMQNTDFMHHLINLRDIFATFMLACFTKINKSIEEERKKPLIVNSVLSTASAIAGGYLINQIAKKPINNIKENFIKANKSDPKLEKYLEGGKVLKPIIILSGLYYYLIPMLSTTITEKLTKASNGNKK